MYTQTTDREISLLLKKKIHVGLENGILTRRLDDFEARLSRIEVKFHFDTKVTIVAQGVPYDPTENPQRVLEDLIKQGLEIVDIHVVRAKHLDSRQAGKPEIMKSEVKTLDQKIKLLKNKRSLNNPQNKYKNVYIHISKSHVERLLGLNTYTLLQEIPAGWQFRLTANGRLVKNDGRRQGQGPGLRQTFGDRNQWRPPTQHP